MSTVAAELAEQTASNLSGVDHYDTFAGHREHLTRVACAGVPEGSGLKLCVLGAGNCNDLDLATLAAHYESIHLVDIDASALERAVGRQTPATQAHLVRHAPVDLTGFADRLERWKAFQVTPEELIGHAGATADRVNTLTSGPFDVVLSACVLTQMQLMVVNVLGDKHRLFEAVRHTLTLTHLRTLARLLKPGGRALLATDVSSERIARLGSPTSGEDLKALLKGLASRGQIFQVADPAQFAFMVRDDPTLMSTVSISEPLEVWRWENGPQNQFLVYALELKRGA
ncbi:MAG TPA: hypothetical protein VG937_12150 [Polyangiaceae bacterium]|nr:hypothetical protein [Polyangiaceae bacterium]